MSAKTFSFVGRTLIIFLTITSLVLSSCHNKIILYKQEFKASEILGSGSHWGPKQRPKARLFVHSLPSVEHPEEWLGSYYTTDNPYVPQPFLNTSVDESAPILDSINFEYYSVYSFINVLNKDETLRSDSVYLKFRVNFVKAASLTDKRRILYQDINSPYREALEASRYELNRPSVTIDAHSDLQRELKLAAKSSILEIAGSPEFNPLVGAHIQTSYDQLVDVKGAVYQEIRLKPYYVKVASKILRGCHKRKNEIALKYHDTSSEEVIQFFDNRRAAIITSISFIEAKFDYQKIRKLSLGLTAEVNDTTGLSARKKSNRSITITTASTYFSLRFGRDRKLEIGKRPLYMIFRSKKF